MSQTLKHASPGEAKMARKFIKELLDRNLLVSVNDGEEWVVKRSTKSSQILEALCSTDQDTILVRTGYASETAGRFLLIWGNAENGEELVADYTDNELCNEIWNKVFN